MDAFVQYQEERKIAHHIKKVFDKEQGKTFDAITVSLVRRVMELRRR